MFEFIQCTRRLLLLASVCCAALLSPVAAQERVELREEVTDTRVFAVTTTFHAEGQMQTSGGGGKAVSLKLKVDAALAYPELRLPGSGRDAQALRTLRHYDKVQATILVGDQPSSSRLRDDVRLMVAHGQREGVQLFSPSGPLTYNELELLRMPGDSLCLPALLPADSVEPGDVWKPSDWVLQLLTGVEAVEKSTLTCKLESFTNGTARVSLVGEISGATLGAAANIKVEGHYLYDTRVKHVTHLALTQTEKRSVGSVSPGLDLVAKVTLDRAVAATPNRLAGADFSKLPLEPNDANQLLVFEDPEWNVRFYHDRRWHLFHQTPRVAVLRFVEKGNLIAQCNINPLPALDAGQHVAEDQFQAEVQQALGKNFQKIVQAERLDTKDGRWVFRVTAIGQSQLGPTQWVYYAVAAPDGRQIALVFIVEPQLVQALQNHDLSIVGGLEFLPAKKPNDPRAAKK